MTPEQKEWIDTASLYSLLRKWRFGNSEDPIFQGEAGKYYGEKLTKIKRERPAAWTLASKQVGW